MSVTVDFMLRGAKKESAEGFFYLENCNYFCIVSPKHDWRADKLPEVLEDNKEIKN
jgi:hypothetical protein